MRRLDLVAELGLSLTLIAVSGCPTAANDPLLDPPGTAPELAGQWQMQGDSTGWSGCGEIDETGDLETLSDNGFVRTQLGVNTLRFDGVWRPSSFNGIPIEYAGTSEVTKSGDDVRLEAVVTVRSFGVVLGHYTNISEGVLAGDTITGTYTQFSNLPGLADLGSPTTAEATLVRGACD